MSQAKAPVRNILGDEETSGSAADDSSPDSEDSVNFASAEREDGATDYDLDFTHTNNGSPLLNIAGQRRVPNQTQETPVTTRRKSEAVQGQNQANSAAPTSAVDKYKKTTQKQQSAATVAKKPRKATNPMQREQRFLQHVKNLQEQQKMIMPRLPFSRLVRELIMAHAVDAVKIQRSALEALQEASEMYLTQQLQDAYTLTLHRGRMTLGVSDMELLRFIRGRT